MTSSSSAPTTVVVGAGPGISRSLALLRVAQGHRIGLLGNADDVVESLAAELREAGAEVESAVADLADTEATTAALSRLGDWAGEVAHLHFNPSAFREVDPLELALSDLLADVAVGVGGLLVSVQALQDRLVPGSVVTATGSMAADKPWHRAATLGVQKAGMRTLVLCLDTALAERGVRACSVTVRGALAREGDFTPDKVAAAILAAATRDRDDWRTEVPYPG
ncbi:SDR family NAD(P)-dependent oxidoreductase [Nocardioides sp.]|uniref:SDR family NAD(P)-dependent oxidoreductase n=1 Tax=Nocardioides sp. TaxID=35761 RepID=UPI003511C930